jgi:multiple sugar transport system substrate-binding protein
MTITRTVWRGALVAVAAATLLTATACSSGGGAGGGSAGDGKGTINVWAMQGTSAESDALKATVDSFNGSQKNVKAELKLIPGDTYTTTVTNTPSDKLPDVMMIDGPVVASFAYNQRIAPLSDYVSKATIENATAGSTAEGTVDGKLYALAQFDSALGLYANKKLLDEAGVKYPTSITESWTGDEFSAALKTLAEKNPSGKSIELNESGLAGEWGIYAFAPLVWSAGGNVLADNKAAGALDSADSAKALSTFASWKPYSDPNSDGNAFTDGRVAISWSGHWMYPTYSKALGSDLLALPLPNMGKGAKTGNGSLTWGIGASSKNGAAAGKFLDFLLNDENVTAMTTANGAPPATKSAFAKAAVYQPGGTLALWGEQLAAACPSSKITADCVAVGRPVTAGYPVVTKEFGSAAAAIWGGADAQTTLTKAAKAIDQNFADNNGYKP